MNFKAKLVFSWTVSLQAVAGLAVLGTVAALVGCQNAVPTVTKMESVRNPVIVPAKDSAKFFQVNAGSERKDFGNGYQGQLRISQPLADLKGTSPTGYKLRGTVTLVK